MRLSASIFLYILQHVAATDCQSDAWVNCNKYRQCVMTPEGKSYYRTVFCNYGNVAAEFMDFHGDGTIESGVQAQITCIPKSSVACDTKCGVPCEAPAPKPEPAPGKCIENSVSPVSCTKYHLCLGGVQRTVHCNPGLVHDGSSTECQHKSTLAAGHNCGDPVSNPTSGCVESAIEAVTCTTYRMCIGGKNRLVHCNAGLVHDGVSTGCVPKSALAAGATCGPNPGCAAGTVEGLSCTTFRLCANGAMRLVHCNAGLVHDGVSAGCVAKDSLPVGSTCGPAGCVANSVEGRSCTTFRLCAKGAMHLVHCNNGLVHDGVSAKCVTPAELPCDSPCGEKCGCTAGHVISVDCNQFRVCVGGVYKLSMCHTGLVHVGPEAHCIPQSSVPCGTMCGNACPVTPVNDCADGSVLPLSCKKFKYCVDGEYKISSCKAGLVHLGVEARCVPKSSVDCGTTCGYACPTVAPISECEDGSASPVSCRKFKYCVDGSWKMSYCKRGLVHAGGDEAKCVAPSSLACGSTCAAPCCTDGDFVPIDCGKFRYCHQGTWKTSYCHDGLVNMGDEAHCVAQDELACGSKCAVECPTVITDCEPGQVDDSSCDGFSVCDADGHWDTTECAQGTVHVPGATCVDQGVIDCNHQCGPTCPPPVMCPVCPISECPPCTKLIEYKCPCDEINGKLKRLNEDINMIFKYQMEEMSCTDAPSHDATNHTIAGPHIHVYS